MIEITLVKFPMLKKYFQETLRINIPKKSKWTFGSSKINHIIYTQRDCASISQKFHQNHLKCEQKPELNLNPNHSNHRKTSSRSTRLLAHHSIPIKCHQTSSAHSNSLSLLKILQNLLEIFTPKSIARGMRSNRCPQTISCLLDGKQARDR